MRRFQFTGGRVIKTGIAVFLTAWICELIGWPPVFAVITAIVTIEPTVSDSIRKGIIRFPASAIGSAYTVFFISIFGNSPITYTLSAVLTILTCYKLNLHAGLLVATLTAVAMVEVVHSHFLIAFFIRLGTTTIGLLVSTAVNMLILPPDYSKDIIKHIQQISKKTANLLYDVFHDILENRHEDDIADRKALKRMRSKIIHAEALIRYQEDEAKIHPLVGIEKKNAEKVKQQLNSLRMIIYHIENLVHTPLETISWTKADRQIILQSIRILEEAMQQPKAYNKEFLREQMEQLTTLFWEDNKEMTSSGKHPTHFPPELIVLYELIAIYQHIENFYNED
ncbi:MAG TPA: aromatic acid exporter family protein [Cerasibacillus sp.]|uniref:FUSC family protein n=1 Tax=Cerasibacillus sp. TaxID=2498711 RepID=UPI002F421FEB